METVKVDIRKLQQLNDRINQTIDALGQLRQSVHGFQQTVGLQHTTPTYGFTQQLPYGNIPQMSYRPQLVGPQTIVGAQIPVTGSVGLSHTAPAYSELSPWGTSVDPTLAMRFAQSFPFAFYATPPAVW